MNSLTVCETSSLALDLEGVSVRYRVPLEKIPSLKEFAIRWLRRSISYRDHWALRDVDLQVRRGEVFGIVGPNGAGKSTLLKVMARVLRPTDGRVRVWGRVAPLLDLGAGFDMELTGRENIFLNGAILGFSRRQMAERVDRIIEFAGVGEFINAPLRTYSSGMLARLGFAVATDVDADVILIDEILSVGDAVFQKKSRQRIESFLSEGMTVILVSHSPALIANLCDRAAWLQAGAIKKLGLPQEVLSEHLLSGS